MRAVVSVEKVARLDTTVLITARAAPARKCSRAHPWRIGPAGKGPFIALNVAAPSRANSSKAPVRHERGAFTGESDSNSANSNSPTAARCPRRDRRPAARPPGQAVAAIQGDDRARGRPTPYPSGLPPRGGDRCRSLGGRPAGTAFRGKTCSTASTSFQLGCRRYGTAWRTLQSSPRRLHPPLRAQIPQAGAGHRALGVRGARALRLARATSATCRTSPSAHGRGVRQDRNHRGRPPARGAVGRPRCPAPTSPRASLEKAVAAFERSYLLKALEKNDWNVAGTARQLRLP